MKTTTKLTIAISSILFTVFVFACKKGDDDPAISLRSRKNRISGEWRMVEGKVKLQASSPTASYADELYELKEDSYKRIITGNGATFTGSYKMTLNFEKKGEVSFSQAIDSDLYQGSGTWDFIGKVGDLKNKEAVSFRLTSFMGGSNYIDLFNKSTTFFDYRIKELRNDKLVLVTDHELIHLTKDQITTYITCEYTFVQ